MKKNREKKQLNAVSIIYACLIYIFLYLPILIVIIFSFNTSEMNIKFEGFTLSWYARMFDNTELMDAFKTTLIVAVASTGLSVFIGTISAFGMFKFKFRGKSVVDSLLYIPIVIPEIVLGISLLAFFTALKIPMGLLTLIIAHVTFCIPFVIITVRARLSGYDMSIEEASMDLGANQFRTFKRVTLPIIAPGVASGAMLALTMSLDDVVVSFFTSGPDDMTLPIKIFGMVRKGVSPDVNALCTIMILTTVLIMVTYKLIERNSEK
ncbi:ABC transporter permease [Clostridium sp. cel8]|jgi:spermidine/putrescine transport system permease protein|uniref:ABC transporter permease n=1 Tax=unclassified Clostridium TaxID=2614128 RepID=UPI0015F4B570|nr:ABC transporter permease [Clostridium sp. cel8]MBA5850313.1 ABC transporter permease [Clostridium sp. cel8]